MYKINPRVDFAYKKPFGSEENKDLLTLDEATSALDMENEERIRQTIVNLHGVLTVVAIGHRMATLQHADQVLVMEAGRIVAQGSWHEVRESSHADNMFAA